MGNIVLFRVMSADEVDGIENENPNEIGAPINQSAVNTFDDYEENENYAFCFAVDIGNENPNEVLDEIYSNSSCLNEDEIKGPLSIITDLKQNSGDKDLHLSCFTLDDEKFQKLLDNKSIIAGEGFYENATGEHSSNDEYLVNPQVLIQALKDDRLTYKPVDKIKFLQDYIDSNEYY